ncbi:MAG: LuxR C-terminal-related transcriptional regulator [Eubacterium sp.]|nr:LuxR C-terminal-related transcriptional regulator [Eubacterium sp.]MDE6767237.1 LuxR C-terminal-related transcriptional regulator [Eubacterium sp.]
MIDFVEEYMSDRSIPNDDGFDEQRILIKAISKVLPLIIKNELTERQNLCLRMFYIHGKNQMEIARELKLSQPTVSRHIATAKSIVNKCLSYCFYSVKQANEQWLKIE